MRRALVAALVAACACGSAVAAPPRAGLLLPGRALGGVHLRDTAEQVRTRLGHDYGVCRGCATTTWYFTYKPFTQKGLAVELTRGRVSAVYTVWQPDGWHAPKGLRLGTVEEQVNALAGPLVPLVCSGYDALTRDDGAVRTAYYVLDGKLWGFGLLPRSANPCR
jgi:hypothetical protein